MMRDALFGGVNAAVLTAMNADLSVDIDRMAAHSRWLLANGCNNLAILGTTGEANSLGISERIAVMEGLVERGIPAGRLLPGTGTTALTDTVLLTRRAAELGCRGALLLPPFYYKNPSDDGLFAYFSEVIQRTGGDIKIYLYHFPQQAVVGFGVALIARLLAAFPLERPSSPVVTSASGRGPDALIEPLTGRELEILSLLAAGLTNEQIAHKLTISLHTVKTHTTNIFQKLGVTNRTGAVNRAREIGLL